MEYGIPVRVREDTPDMTDPDGTTKQDGLGDDSTIPASDDGIAVTLSDTGSHFNAEEDDEVGVDEAAGVDDAAEVDAVDDGDDTTDSSGVAHGDD
jgi:hypothetical protein